MQSQKENEKEEEIVEQQKQETSIVSGEVSLNVSQAIPQDSSEEASKSCCSPFLQWMDNPFYKLSDNTVRRISDYLPIGSAGLALAGTYTLGVGDNRFAAGGLSLTGAGTLVIARAFNTDSDYRAIMAALRIAKELGLSEEELLPEGFFENVGLYANRISVIVHTVSLIVILLAGLALYGVYNNDFLIGTWMLISLGFIGGFTKFLKEGIIDYRKKAERVTAEHSLWTPEVLRRCKEIAEIRENFKKEADEIEELLKKDNLEQEHRAKQEHRLNFLKELISKCQNCEEILKSKKFDLEIELFVINRLDQYRLDSIKTGLKEMENSIYGLLPTEKHNQAITLWKKVINSANLALVAAEEKYLQFLIQALENVEQMNVVTENLSIKQQDLQRVKGNVSEAAERLISVEQERVIGYPNLYNLRNATQQIEELENTEENANDTPFLLN
ncbi:MAG: hypothetical protein K0R12_1257 [Gammaproteobacteria bacterium]|jgi:hypothetical protein|nr:hypothetical protein [Gammaproteobacteria bacterium]